MSPILQRAASLFAFGIGLANGSAWGAEPYFVETFENPVENPSLQGYEHFRFSEGKLLRQPEDPGDQDRAYMRTVLTDYLTRDFVFDVVFTSGLDTITFVGLGQGDWVDSEPGPSVRLRIHAPDVAGGFVEVSSSLGQHTFAHLLTRGPHCARIEKRDTRMTFSIDLDFDGEFKADGSRGYPRIDQLGPFLDTESSRLFFGGGSQTTQFDAVTVAAIEAPRLLRRGDVNVDGAVNIVDPVRILNYAFSGSLLDCLDAADADDDGSITITDAIGLLGYLYLGTIAPPAPFHECGLDATNDELGCKQFQHCVTSD